MAGGPQSFLAKLGTRLSTLGSLATIAFAFPLSEGAQGMDAHTDATRTGFYAVAATKIGHVVDGTEVFTVGATSITANVPLNTPAVTAAGAGINIGQGTVPPTTPNNGDLWITASGLFARVAGVTVGPFGAGGGTVTGSGTSGQVTYWSSASAITGSAGYTFSTASGLHVSLNGATNEMVGTAAGNSTMSGVNNVLMGASAGNAFTSAHDNTYLGWEAGFKDTIGLDNVYVGSQAGAQTIGSSF